MKRILHEIHRGRIFSVAREEHAMPDGRRAAFDVVRHPGGAAVLPLLEDGRVVLIRQFRPAIDGMVLEIPAGRLEAGEAPAACAARELQEEVGYRARRLQPLGEMLTAVGFCDERLHLFVGRDLTAVERSLEADEYIETEPMPLAEAVSMAARGRIPDAKTQLALLLFAARIEHGT